MQLLLLYLVNPYLHHVADGRGVGKADCPQARLGFLLFPLSQQEPGLLWCFLPKTGQSYPDQSGLHMGSADKSVFLSADHLMVKDDLIR